MQQQSFELQQQRRMSQYRFQQQYVEHLREQQVRIQQERHDFNNDPYFYTAPVYRYNRGGSYYEVNQYGADLLRQAVNNGYQEGFNAGQADREDNWRPDFQNSYAYQDALYGYDGYYLSPDDYQYYFRQGFQRGYEDGYNQQYQYGYQSNGSYGVLGNVLQVILNFQSIR
jgi:flagellar biosynthesis/type III secretory pathway protein FliH